MGTGFRDIARRLQRLFDRPLVPPPGAVSALAAEALAQSKVFREDRIFSAVGHALSMWARMEEGLVAIAGALLRTPFDKAGIIMYSMINFNVWLSIIDELFSIDPLLKKLKPKWNQVSVDLRAIKDIRDRLAHDTIYDREFDKVDSEKALRPGRLDLRSKSRSHKPMSVDQIWEFYHSVARVGDRITALLNEITLLMDEQLSSREKSSSPNPDPDRA